MILNTARVPAGLSTLYGQHVRLRPVDSAAKPADHWGIGDRFGILTDISSDAFVALRDRYDPEMLVVYRTESYNIDPYPSHRIHVFFYPHNGENFWTWCREVGGDVLDSYSGLDRYGSWDEAWATAQRWLSEALARDAERVAT